MIVIKLVSIETTITCDLRTPDDNAEDYWPKLLLNENYFTEITLLKLRCGEKSVSLRCQTSNQKCSLAISISLPFFFFFGHMLYIKLSRIYWFG